MRRRLFVPLVVIIVFMSYVGSWSTGDDSASEVPAEPFDAPAGPVTEKNEIMRIRREVGTAWRLEPTDHQLADADEQSFASALSELLKNPKSSAGVEGPSPIDRPTANRADDDELIERLRDTSGLLDAKALRLERVRKYQMAAALRKLSKRMRQTARLLDESRE
jgi:hypothetical protein